MTDLLTNMRRELAQLEAEVKNDPRIIKINGLKELIAVYDPQANPGTAKNIMRTPAPKAAKRPPKGSKEKEIKTAVRALLIANNTAHRTEILQHLEGRKLMGWETKPMKSLAIYLSKWRDEFQSDGAGNYSIRNK
jgi:hypothetical protein